jgi:hypothetical protein
MKKLFTRACEAFEEGSFWGYGTPFYRCIGMTRDEARRQDIRRTFARTAGAICAVAAVGVLGACAFLATPCSVSLLALGFAAMASGVTGFFSFLAGVHGAIDQGASFKDSVAFCARFTLDGMTSPVTLPAVMGYQMGDFVGGIVARRRFPATNPGGSTFG